MNRLTMKRRTFVALTSAGVLTAAVRPGAPAAAAPRPDECAQAGPDRPMQVTADCVDPTYARPVIDSESDEAAPVAHHRVSGHFEGTNIDFNIYLHVEQDMPKWEGRFFQYTYPTAFTAEQDTSRASDRAIGFALSNGGYAVQAGNGSLSLGYRHSAAAAKYAKTVAAEYYGSDRRIYGYLYGPSGGSFQTVGAAENTAGVWDGFVPMVQAVPQPTRYNFLGRSAAELILRDKADQIQDALLPGGSGDPYATLDEAERAMLTEVHALGIPWEGWANIDYMLGYDEQFYSDGLDSDDPLDYDPTYVEDFWEAEGYLGAEASPLGERVRTELAEAGDNIGNRWNIAKRFYYRYQIPPASEGWIGLDQFRKPDGSPLYPQRPVSPPDFAGAVSGYTAFDGSINAKMIAVSNLYDTDALPWHTDWYRQRVEASLGETAAENYRVYFNDHADHQEGPVLGERAAYLVNWYGIAEQALRYIAHWAEDDVSPPSSTRYSIEDAQVSVPSFSLLRAGIQPSVNIISPNGGVTNTKVGEPTHFFALTSTPHGGGQVIRADWDFDGDGEYVSGDTNSLWRIESLSAKHTFTKPGTYFASLRVAAECDSDVNADYGVMRNIDRVRVVVTE